MADASPTPARSARVPVTVRWLNRATRTYLDILRDALPDVVALAASPQDGEDHAGRLMDLMQVALVAREMGTPASIGLALAELLGEATAPAREL